jgi:hypothetical protein
MMALNLRNVLTLSFAGVVGAALSACSDSPSEPPLSPTVTATASANPNNVLSALVDVQTTSVDSVRVVVGSGAAVVALTPWFPSTAASMRVPVLGLRKLTSYSLTVEARGLGKTATSSPIAFTTADLPDPLGLIRVRTVTGIPTPGYMLTASDVGSTTYAMAFDSTGTLVWYRIFPNPDLSVSFSQQKNGNYTIYLGVSQGWQPGPGKFVEFTPAGDVVREWTPPDGSYVDGHDIILTTDAQTNQPVAHFFTYTIRTTDATSVGGSAAAPVAQHSLIRERQTGAPEIIWNSWDHFALSDWVITPRFGPFDVDHPNSLDIAPDGNYIVSWRNVSEITKINATTGAAIWRLGGLHNQFTFINDPFNGPSGQHYVRMTPQGTLLVYDNGVLHSPSQTRAVEYRLDETAKTATMVQQFKHTPLIFTPVVGTAQRLANGNTFVGYGTEARATEFAPDASVVWEGRLEANIPVSFYRLEKAYSLYYFSTPR